MPAGRKTKKKRVSRPGQFGAAAPRDSDAPRVAKRSKASILQKAAATQLTVLDQDKGAVGNSIAETARSVGQAGKATAQRDAAMRLAAVVAPVLLDEALSELIAAAAAEAYESDLEQDRLVKLEVNRLVDDVVQQQEEWDMKLEALEERKLEARKKVAIQEEEAAAQKALQAMKLKRRGLALMKRGDYTAAASTFATAKGLFPGDEELPGLYDKASGRDLMRRDEIRRDLARRVKMFVTEAACAWCELECSYTFGALDCSSYMASPLIAAAVSRRCTSRVNRPLKEDG